MRKNWRFGLSIGACCAMLIVPSLAQAQVPDNPFEGVQMNEGFRRPDPRILEFANISRGAKVQEGLFKVYQKEDAAYLELQPQHLGKPILCPIAVAKGAGMGGMTLNFDEQWVLLFKRAGEKVHLIRRNVHFKARAGTPTARAVDITYTDSVLMSLRIAAINQMNQGLLINLNDIFMTDFAELNLGAFDSSRSVWGKIKVFPRNIELEVQATYSSGRFGGGDSNIDSRGQTVVIHYGLAELPDGGYQPRVADDRVGYFVTAVKDFSSASKDTAFVRYVNRWRLEPADQIDVKNGKLSVPKRSIKFYIEKTVPHEYRAAVQEGILEWNKAFEKIGFRNAIEVVQQRDDEDFDPEDMNYNTFRWITSDSAFAMGPSRANPLTGEILDADIIFDADLIRFWKQERQIFRQNGIEFESPSSILAMDMGFGLNHQLLNRRSINGDWNESPKRMSESQSLNRLRAIQQGVCQCGSHMKYELGMAALAQIQRELLPQPKEKAPVDKDKPKDKDKEKSDKEKADANKDKILDELIHQAIKAIVMHEVGHTLGLRHNFKGSTMLANDQLHDTKITHEKGLLGSVMDYAPVNLAPKGVKQGDYFTTTLGPYDFWAIEYAYKPLTGGTDGEVTELKKIASRGASEAGLDYGTDEDTFLTSDPLINRWDMGNDVMKFSQDRMLIAQELLKNLANQVVDEGEGYQRTRVAFNLLLNQYGNSSYLIAKYVGGEHAYRDHRGDPKGRDPLVPVNTTKQREALKFLQENIFTDKTFQYPPDLLRKLAVDRWSHWGADTDSTDFSVHNRVLSIQRMAMNQLLSVSALERIQNNSLKSEKDGKPLQISEVFRTITDGVWSDLPKGDKKATASSAIRRNLQREHLKKLSEIVLGEKSGGFGIMFFFSGGGSLPPDAKSLAFAHLKEIDKRIEAALKDKPADADETTLAHLEECHDRIAKILNASMQIND